MLKRYPDIKTPLFCHSPRLIVKDNYSFLAPCGKCSGCQLHRNNLLSQRIGNEIDFQPFSIFGTLTYTNKYLPKLYKIGDVWISDHKNNIRFNGVSDVLRSDNIVIVSKSDSIAVQNFDDYPCIPYLSKRDIQLFLKLLRKKIYEKFRNRPEVNQSLRYLVVGEIGPTTFRPHFHFILWCQEQEVCDFLLSGGIFSCWSMCDEELFQKYTHLCDAGARNYVSQYVLSPASIPEVYRVHKELRPFRLSSKSPSIGMAEFDFKTVFESIISGTLEYNKDVVRLGSKVVLRYSSDLLNRFFPKTKGYSKYSFERLFSFFACVCQPNGDYEFDSVDLFSRFSPCLDLMDANALRQCVKFCSQYGLDVHTYTFAHDRCHYLIEMSSLRAFYENQKSLIDHGHILDAINQYINLSDYVKNSLPYCKRLIGSYFAASFGFIYEKLCDVSFSQVRSSVDYENECTDILSDAIKLPKLNELHGVAPHII